MRGLVVLDGAGGPVPRDRDDVATRIGIAQRYEARDMWSDSLAVAYALGAEPVVERMFAIEERILSSALAGAACVSASVDALDGALDLLDRSAV